MKILFIGGYGNISWYCTKKAIERGYEVYLLNRDLKSGTRREIPQEAKLIHADIRNIEECKNILKDYEFDVICDFLCYNGEHAQSAIELFKDKTKQYIYISSDAVYKNPDKDGLFRETSEKYKLGEGSDYANGKLEAEIEFQKAYKEMNFPVTIVRPSYTYDTILLYSIGHNCYTSIQRYLDGKPLLMAGDGNNLWTFTHSRDFANIFVELFGKKECIGETYQISSDTVETFNYVMKTLLKLFGLKKVKVIHIPEKEMMEHEEFSPKDMKQRFHNRLFDNSKIKNLFPDWKSQITIEQGLKETVDWLNENPKRKRFVPALDEKLENLTNCYKKYEKEITLDDEKMSCM